MNKGTSKSKLNGILKEMKRKKKFDSKQHLGKVKWNRDAFEFQKELRDGWG